MFLSMNEHLVLAGGLCSDASPVPCNADTLANPRRSEALCWSVISPPIVFTVPLPDNFTPQQNRYSPLEELNIIMLLESESLCMQTSNGETVTQVLSRIVTLSELKFAVA